MVSTVEARPNHYETLGIEPTASDDEIARAFQRRMLAPSAADMARIGPAFATLRDPARRRAYDEAIGLRREPAPRPPQPHYSFAVKVSPGAAGFIGSAVRERTEDNAGFVEAPPPIPPIASQRIPPAHAEGGGDGAAVLAEPREQVILEAPGRQSTAKPEAEVEKLQAKLGAFLATAPSRDERPADERPPEWKKLGLAGGGVVLAVALIGAWAGMKTSAATDPKKAQVASLLLPPPTTYSVEDPAAGSGVRAGPNLTPPSAPTRQRAGRISERRSKRGTAGSEDRLAGISQSLQEASPGVAQPEMASAPAAQPVQVTQAAMPLPNKVIASTLHRIGYSCGSVASTTAADSAGGYTVTCTSGHSYSAKPVRGRYHFRRL
jgi:hypothetical protein